MPSESFYVIPSVIGISTVNCYVLVVIVVTEVPLPKIFIHRMASISISLGVGGIGRFMRDIKLIGSSGEKVAIGSFFDHWCIEILFWDLEMCSCWVSNNNNSQPGRVWTEIMLVAFGCFGIDPIDAIAVLIEDLISGFSSRINIFGKLIAIGSPPIISPKSRNIGKCVIVQIKRWEMTVCKFIHEEMYEPLPRRWFLLIIFDYV